VAAVQQTQVALLFMSSDNVTSGDLLHLTRALALWQWEDCQPAWHGTQQQQQQQQQQQYGRGVPSIKDEDHGSSSSSGSGSSSSQQSADEGVAVQPRQPIEVLLPAVVEAAVARRYEFSLQVRNIPFDIPLVLAWPYLRVTCINTAYGAKPLA
jgi:hypothetical protein